MMKAVLFDQSKGNKQKATAALGRNFWYMLVFILISMGGFSQTIKVQGNIDNDTNWNVDTVQIYGDVIVGKGVKLTIGPGVYIEAKDYYGIFVKGCIEAKGQQNDSITFTVRDTTGFWTDTTSVKGGWHGIYIVGKDESQDSSVFSYCNVHYGKNYDDHGKDVCGGGLYVCNHKSLLITHSRFTNNMVICYADSIDGPYGGAVYCENVENVRIDSSNFIRNRSFYYSGAIRVDKGCKNTIISHNTFIGNIAFFYDIIPGWIIYGGVGAAVSTSDLIYSPEISDNFCFNNKSPNGIIYTSNRYARIFNNVICNNWGCGIFDGHQLSSGKVFNNTIINNKTRSGGLYLWSNVDVFNNICWGNSYYDWKDYDQIQYHGSKPKLMYNCVQYGDGGEGAIYEAPEFVDPSAGVGLSYDGAAADWALQNTSPCINTGTDDTAFLTIPPFDIIGSKRIFGNRIDMGAYENQEISVYIVDDNVQNTDFVQVFPNPANSFVTINFRNAIEQKPESIRLINVIGNEIYSAPVSGIDQSMMLDVSDWPKGVYFIVIQSSDRVISKTKLIVN